MSEVNKRLNVRMVESKLNAMQWILCGNLNLNSVDWNILSSDDQRESSFFISLKKFNLGLLTDNQILQRDVLLTYIIFVLYSKKTKASQIILHFPVK